jgi:hypothetical protein
MGFKVRTEIIPINYRLKARKEAVRRWENADKVDGKKGIQKVKFEVRPDTLKYDTDIKVIVDYIKDEVLI